MFTQYWERRGQPWEYDPGPAANRRWAQIFAQTPNYRGIGKALLGHEQFRWHFGPMFYRGRLGDGQVKVLITGLSPVGPGRACSISSSTSASQSPISS
jgi:hypothetical protein